MSRLLGCKVVGISALRGDGIDELIEAIDSAEEKPNPIALSNNSEKVIRQISEVLRGTVPDERLRWYAVKALERDSLAIEKIGDSWNQVSEFIEAYEKAEDDDSDSIVASERYEAIGKTVSSVLKSGRTPGEYTISDKIDKIVTNKWLGLQIGRAHV